MNYVNIWKIEIIYRFHLHRTSLRTSRARVTAKPITCTNPPICCGNLRGEKTESCRDQGLIMNEISRKRSALSGTDKRNEWIYDLFDYDEWNLRQGKFEDTYIYVCVCHLTRFLLATLFSVTFGFIILLVFYLCCFCFSCDSTYVQS